VSSFATAVSARRADSNDPEPAFWGSVFKVPVVNAEERKSLGQPRIAPAVALSPHLSQDRSEVPLA
jgi:hypothetical protein